MTHFTGTCHGGPMSGTEMTHGSYAYRLAYFVNAPMWAIPGMVGSKDPGIAFGVYVFDPKTETWHWREAADSVLAKTDVDKDRPETLVP